MLESKGVHMNRALNENTLLDTDEKHQQMARLIILKLAAEWLEKQDWVSSPYGGQNPVQDLIFQIRLTTNRTWEDFFKNKDNGAQYDAIQLKEKILQMSDLDDGLRDFFCKTLQSQGSGAN